jgi:hypothetical protein
MPIYNRCLPTTAASRSSSDSDKPRVPADFPGVADSRQSQYPNQEPYLRDGGPTTTTAEPRRHEAVHQRRPEEFEVQGASARAKRPTKRISTPDLCIQSGIAIETSPKGIPEPKDIRITEMVRQDLQA